MNPTPNDTGLVRLSLDIASAVFGVFSAFLMSRRYASSFLLSLFFALVAPLFFVVGQGDHVREYYSRTISANRDVPLSAGQMALGFNLLFWAFFLQLLGLFF